MVTAATIHDAFLPFGDIADVTMPKNENPNSNTTEPHRGFAYVEFEDADDAKEALDNMDQSELFGRVIKVTAAKAPKSADEGLGSKKALWEQVGPFFQCVGLRLLPRANKKASRTGELVGKECCRGGGSTGCRASTVCSRGVETRGSDARSRRTGCGWSSPSIGPAAELATTS